MRKFLMAAAAITLMTMTTVLTSCTSNDDNPSSDPTHDSAVVGNWYADITNQTCLPKRWPADQIIAVLTNL